MPSYRINQRGPIEQSFSLKKTHTGAEVDSLIVSTALSALYEMAQLVVLFVIDTGNIVLPILSI